MTNLIGQSLGRYHILEQLGEGGMAVVYKALDTNLGRHVALKVILPYRQHSEKFLKRFEREARALARLSHPNILKIFDYGEYRGLPYLVMEYIPGGTLAQKLTGKPLPWLFSANFLARIARALETAHLQGVIHRDVKPSNILISSLREPLLSDFGIAKLVESDEETVDLTGSGVGIGTPQYMAPEQGLGHSDGRSDVYALGVIFYEMVTGRIPYQADTPLAIMLKKNTEPLSRPTQFIPDLPASVDNVLIKALARDANQRYATMGLFADALENLSGQKNVTLPDISSGTVTFDDSSITRSIATERSNKNWVWWGIGGVVLTSCCVVGLVGFMARGFFNPATIPTLIPTEISFSTPIPATVPMDSSQISPTSVSSPTLLPADTPVPVSIATEVSVSTLTVELSAGGKWIAFNSRKPGNADIYLIDINGNNLTQLTTSTAHDLYPSWSPDGSQIVYQTNEGGDQELMVINISTRETRMLTSNTCDDWGPTWSPDGEWVAYYSNCGGERDVYKVRWNGNDRQQLTSSSGAYSWFPSWSPDGEKITFTSNRSGNYNIYVMDADGNNQQQLARGCVSYFSPDGRQILYGIYCSDTDDLWLMNSDGSNQHPITQDQECRNATWSPDGSKIVFEQSKSGKDGPFAQYIMSLDNPDPSNWLMLTDYDIDGRSPVWQP